MDCRGPLPASIGAYEEASLAVAFAGDAADNAAYGSNTLTAH